MSDQMVLAQRLAVQQVPTGATIFHEGDDPGKLEVFSTNEGGKRVTLKIDGEGDYFGEVVTITGAKRNAGAHTMDALLLPFVDYEEQPREYVLSPAASG